MNVRVSADAERSTLSPRGRRLLVLILTGGLVLRIALAASTEGVAYDIESYRVTGEALVDEGFHVYREVVDRMRELDEPASRWPYPPGFFPVLVAADAVRHLNAVPYRTLIRLPLIAADLLIALALALSRGRLDSERRRLCAATLVAFGPSFFLISAYQGQLDAAATLPALVAVIVWRRSESPRRGALAGTLIGLGAAIKTVPIVLAAVLVPRAASRSERIKTAVCAVAVPASLLAPFLLAEPRATLEALHYTGAPGVGGLSLAVQPSLAFGWILHRDVTLTTPSAFLQRHAAVVVATALLAVALLLWVRRPAPEDGAVVVWLALYAFAPSFFFQYLVWGLPFLLLAGRLRAGAAIQVVVAAPTVIALLRPWGATWIMYLYLPAMLVLWAGFVVAFAVAAGRMVRSGSQPVTE